MKTLTPDILELALEMQDWKGKIMGSFQIHFDNKGQIVQVDKRIIVKLKERRGRQSKSK